jgi:hypothetical protein
MKKGLGRREVEHLSKAQLKIALEEAIMSQGTSELAVIYLINHYEFDLRILKAILVGMPV